MKKISLFLAAIFCMGMTINAQNVHGEYLGLSVDYYNHGSKTGHLIVNNQTGATISKAHIKVTVLITWTEEVDIPNVGKMPQTNKKTLVLCDDDIYNISTGESKITSSRRGDIKGGPHKPNKNYKYNVEIVFESPFPGQSSGGDSYSSSSSSSTSDGELVMRGEILHTTGASAPAPSRITVDVYRTSDGKYYVNMTSPESIKKMPIFKMTGSVYNGYVKYMNSYYYILINDSRW